MRINTDGKDAGLVSLVKPGINTLDKNYADKELLRVFSWTHGGIPYTQRALLDFPLPPLPQGASVWRSELNLYSTLQNTLDPNGNAHSQLSHNNATVLQRVTAPWEENTVTWNTQPPVSENDKISIAPSSDPNQNYKINVTPWIKGFYQGSIKNHGFLLKLRDEQAYSSLNFISGDNSSVYKRPRLRVEYTCK